MSISQRLFPALAGFIAIVLTACGGSSSGGDSGGAIDPPLTVPTISAPAENQSVVKGETVTFKVLATGNALTYQWKKNGTDISGATSSNYTTPAMSYAGKGALYSVEVSNSAGKATSSSATLTVGKTSTPKSYGLVANASDGLYDATECVQDNNTGLVWEGKTDSLATSRRGIDSYTNYDDVNSAQKWYSAAYVNPTQEEIDDSTNSIGYKNAVNTSALCGFTDWRMPTSDELQGILASGGSPRIDTAWFPNTQASYYWTSSPYVGNPPFPTDSGGVQYVNFGPLILGSPTVFWSGRNGYGRVRLVRE